MKNVIKLYEDEIESKFEELPDSGVLNGDYEGKLENINKLTDKYVSLQKVQVEATKAENERNKICYEHEEALIAQENEQKISKRKEKLDLLGIIVPTAGAIWGVVYTWYKEQEGINSTAAGKAMTNSLLKFLKR